ncbi:hypothetical protein [Pyxidicoccus trucidator]|uniref:hypothetical protein n=1 Tax=Pyxidicoccus trucidator TaxID=2709662 RepID=UPI0013DD332B|nr:hypothetical protein [Pyxidicoccus trucidator]
MVLVGGYGVVGAEVGRVLRARHPSLPLVLAGRNPHGAKPWPPKWGASLHAMDLMGSSPLDFSARAVIALVNDPVDRLLRGCLRAGIPFVDITCLGACLPRPGARRPRW